ncbi:MAG: Maf family protein [Endomicrobiaceae bacterium]|nr:Maf family protein [Endomicrobiaceae bacterium]
MENIVLASASPRRKELLEKMGLKFIIIPSNYEEKLFDNIYSDEKIETLALNKAKDVAQRVQEPSIIIAADTVVVLDNLILGKPKDKQDAFNMIKSLSGKTHFVVTAIAIIDSETKKIKVSNTKTFVTFTELKDEEIQKYVSTDEPYDKAGAYAAQGYASIFIEKIEGCFNNVVGISTFTLNKMLKDFI